MCGKGLKECCPPGWVGGLCGEGRGERGRGEAGMPGGRGRGEGGRNAGRQMGAVAGRQMVRWGSSSQKGQRPPTRTSILK